MNPIIDWIYKYVNPSHTCSILCDEDGITCNDVKLGMRIAPDENPQLGNETNEGFNDLQIFGIIITVLISILGILVLVGFLWKQRFFRVYT